jgi:hypothetical protein
MDQLRTILQALRTQIRFYGFQRAFFTDTEYSYFFCVFASSCTLTYCYGPASSFTGPTRAPCGPLEPTDRLRLFGPVT